MDTRFLQSLIEVVDAGSIAEAARRQSLTAAAISQRIQSLERQLGHTLLVRGAQLVRPTAQCQALLPRARAIVREVSLLARDADLSGSRGPLRLGCISTALTGILPNALMQLSRTAPAIRPVVTPGSSRDLFQAVIRRDLDAALVVAPPFELPASIRARPVASEALVLITPPPWTLDLADCLRSRRYIRYDPEAWGGRQVQRYVQASLVEPDVLCDLDGLEAIAELVGRGMGFSVVPRWQGLEKFGQHCRIVDLAAAGHERAIVLVHPAESSSMAMIEALAAVL